MPTPVEDLFKRASSLNDKDRATLAGLLLESLEHEIDEDIESAWQGEIDRRLADLNTSGVELVRWEDVKAALRTSPGAQHPD